MANQRLLPTPRRAQEIVDEARRRLAEQNGKASMLPAMIERVKAERLAQDQAAAMHEGYGAASNYLQPPSIDRYIDRVLEMSGMNTPVPTPTPRPSSGTSGAPVGEVERGGPLPDAAPNPANDADNGTGIDEQGNPTDWNEYAQWLAIGGTAYAAYKFMQKYGRAPTEADINASPDRASARVSQAHGDPINATIDEIDGQQSIAEEKRPRLAPPAQQIEGPRTALPAPTAIDESIDSTIEEAPRQITDQRDIDQVFQDRVEGRSGPQVGPGPNRYTGQSATDDAGVARIIEQATIQAESGDIRGAVKLLRDNGIEMDDNMLRLLVEGSNTFKTLQQRLGNVSRQAVR